MKNIVEFSVKGKYALFTDPITKIGGEKCTYQVPTYQALKGIIESVYWKPTIIWEIDSVRIMNKIQTETKSMRPILMNDATKPNLSIYTYLVNVHYKIKAHFIWNENRKDMTEDRNENKHFFIAKRMIERGGRRDVFLGTRECQAYVEPTVFEEGVSTYDNCGNVSLGIMFHGFDYPDETGIKELSSRFSHITLNNGIIEFEKPSECTLRKTIKKMSAKDILSSGTDEQGLLEGYEEEVF